MAYTTNPIANRLGLNQGWNNSLVQWQKTNHLTNLSGLTYMKCYLLLKEYFTLYQINLLNFQIKNINQQNKLIYILIYKPLRYFNYNKNFFLRRSFYEHQKLSKKTFLQLILKSKQYYLKNYFIPTRLPLESRKISLHLREKIIYLNKKNKRFDVKKNNLISSHISKLKERNTMQLSYTIQNFLQTKFNIFGKVKIQTSNKLINVLNLYKIYKNKYKLRAFSAGSFFKRLLYAFTNTERYMHPQIIADLIAKELQFPRKHRSVIKNIQTLFDMVHSKYILGYKILIDGKINGRMMSTKLICSTKGKTKVPVQEFDKRISCALSISRTYAGAFGIKVWLYY